MYENIRNETIFDYCDNAAVLAKYTSGVIDKDAYLAELALIPKWEADAHRIMAISDYAENTGNTALQQAVRERCDDILSRFFNE